MEEQNRQELEKRAPIFEVQAPAAGGYGPDMDDSPRGGLLDYWRMIQRRKGTVLLAAFLGALAAVLYTLPQTPIYQARTTLEVQDINSSSAIPGSKGFLGSEPDPLGQGERRLCGDGPDHFLQSAQPEAGAFGVMSGDVAAARRERSDPSPGPFPSKNRHAGASKVRSSRSTRQWFSPESKCPQESQISDAIERREAWPPREGSTGGVDSGFPASIPRSS